MSEVDWDLPLKASCGGAWVSCKVVEKDSRGTMPWLVQMEPFGGRIWCYPDGQTRTDWNVSNLDGEVES